MFGIGMSEMLIILAVALLVFGPQKLPEIAKSIAKGLKELRRAGDDLRSSVNFDLDEDKPARRPLPRAASSAVQPDAANAAPSSSSPTEPAAIPGSELATGSAAEEQWPKPATDTLARGDDVEPAHEAVPTSVDESKVH